MALGEMESEEVGDSKNTKLWELMGTYLCSDRHSIQRSIANHVELTLAASRFDFDASKCYRATAHSIRDRLIEAWNDTNAYFDRHDPKRVAYMSLEYLMGRAMQNALLNLDLEANYRDALGDMGFDLEKLYEEEPDAALGNGGLGRLAACFLDSLAALNMPAWGYGLRYTFGIFKQRIKGGDQVEVPDYWLTFGNPWEIERVDIVYPVRFYGEVITYTDEATGHERKRWRGGEVVMAVAYDNPVPGFDTFNTINLRLWKAAPSSEFDLSSFNAGDYMRAVEARQRAETISHVLYPADNHSSGKELRLKQQYLFVSATLQDVIRRFLKVPGRKWDDLPRKLAVQLNDTHPALAVADLMRILVDDHALPWDHAWSITRRVFSYTNHTLLPEALEKWPVDLLASLLPRHLEIIFLINWHWLQEVQHRHPGDTELLSRMSIVEEGMHKQVRMAHLAIVGSHAVNGVAAIHTHLLRTNVFPHFDAFFPGKFQNKTNGVTPRRWINQCNPELAALITRWLAKAGSSAAKPSKRGSSSKASAAMVPAAGAGTAWLKDLSRIEALREFADDETLHEEWRSVKADNKARLAAYIADEVGIRVDEEAIFDIQIKR
ncbi:glpV [Symbiodinium sp. KB8]|nr:glpV [Symbiodinium sp. KB8]